MLKIKHFVSNIATFHLMADFKTINQIINGVEQ